MREKSLTRARVIVSMLVLFLLLPVGNAFAMGYQPPAPLPTGLTTDNHFNWGMYERYFDVYIPANLDEPAPLVVEMHGLTSDKESIRGYSGLHEKADQEGFIIVWPQGILNSWNGVICCPSANLLNVDDLGFLTEMVGWISDRAQVDADRVYATGHSNGGAMSHQLALRATDMFAAIAPVSFHLTDSSTWSAPSRPIPMLEIHGNRDSTVAYPWGPAFGTVEDGFHDWAYLNGCLGQPEITWENGNGAFRETYQVCNSNVKVEWMVLNAAHNDIHYNNDDGVDVAQVIWDFLSQYSLP